MSIATPISADAPIRLVSRASPLALAQAQEVVAQLRPTPCRIDTLTTQGDAILDRSLAEIGGKGVFVKTLEMAVLDGRADAAVHSAKDMETILDRKTKIIATLKRHDRRDALLGGWTHIDALPDGAIIGTASVRRKAMLAAHRPDLRFRLLRGNVDTRLKRLEAGEYDAIILAVAGLKRIGATVPYHPIDEALCLPSAGQGVIALQGIADTSISDTSIADTSRTTNPTPHDEAIAEVLHSLNHQPTALELHSERGVLAAIDGSCATPIGVSAHYSDGAISIKARLYSLDGSRAFSAAKDKVTIASNTEAEALGRALGAELLRLAGGAL